MTRAWRAELSKLRTLPLTAYAAGGMVTLGAVLALAFAALHADGGGVVSPVAAALDTVPYVQAGAILLGVLPVSQEYAGRQLSTTLTAVPHRLRVVVAKTFAAVVVLALAAVATVAAAWLVAEATLRATDMRAAAVVTEDLSRLGGAALYLVLIGLLAHAVTLVLRHLVAALVSMLVLVFILPFAVTALGEHTRWLPTRAGVQLFAHDDAVLTAVTGGLVLLGWAAVIGAAGAVRFARSDA
ncbi:ABC transporter permease [Microbacterium sp. MYb62]|uniref:ABC transporter permease n=1 Tax=Microbacterium sp. MYb62 TaxID=1848690 RepID=UPI000CFAE284|nr:ABC transporter permease [Microbacterium sp. MYb62]PRB17340.1 ABC transporter permease [Microbacterium sp. MYb62]